jgi:hypothetical protein
MTSRTNIFHQLTLYFLFKSDTKTAVTKSEKYSEISELMKKGENSGLLLGEVIYDTQKKETINIIPPDAIPMETKYRIKAKVVVEPDKPRASKLFTIREPIWKNPRAVGLNTKEIEDATEDVICVKIVYRMKTKGDELLYPSPFFMDRDKALGYPVQKVTAGTRVTIIPIQDFRDRA